MPVVLCTFHLCFCSSLPGCLWFMFEGKPVSEWWWNRQMDRCWHGWLHHDTQRWNRLESLSWKDLVFMWMPVIWMFNFNTWTSFIDAYCILSFAAMSSVVITGSVVVLFCFVLGEMKENILVFSFFLTLNYFVCSQFLSGYFF